MAKFDKISSILEISGGEILTSGCREKELNGSEIKDSEIIQVLLIFGTFSTMNQN